jgi:hypothetical protein
MPRPAPDLQLVVGIKQSGPHPEDPGLSAVETTTHFAAWAILSLA